MRQCGYNTHTYLNSGKQSSNPDFRLVVTFPVIFTKGPPISLIPGDRGRGTEKEFALREISVDTS